MLDTRSELELQIRALLQLRADLEQTSEDTRNCEHNLGPEWRLLAQSDIQWPQSTHLLRIQSALILSTKTLRSRFKQWRARRAMTKILVSLARQVPEVDCSHRLFAAEEQALEQILRCAVLSELYKRIQNSETTIRDQRDWNELIEAHGANAEQISKETQQALFLLPATFGNTIPDRVRFEIINLKGEIGKRNLAGKFHEMEQKVHQAIRQLFPTIIKSIPLWACSNLSIRSRLPLMPGAFDLAVIDEASQCHIPSCIPILFRAKRAVIVGDPMQLRHVGKVAENADARFRSEHKLSSTYFGRFRYTTNSIWEPSFAAAQVGPNAARMLKEHWRCHPAIAEYFSRLFYGSQLQIRSDLQLAHEEGARRAGIEWTHIPGDGQVTYNGSRYHPEQIKFLVAELIRLKAEGFEGSIGVVTPFRAHADRIRDAAHAAIDTATLNRWRFLCQTADGFQGDERRIVYFALIGGPDPNDVPSFYRREINRFNVAVSRAQRLLHVVADRQWAASCGERTLVELHSAWLGWQEVANHPDRSDLIGPVWEPMFAKTLREAGIEFRQQYPACGYYLDFAVFSGCQKINVEVDGEAYHRTATGDRQESDLRRDQILRAAGWTIQRFWVYQLREDLGSCLAQVQSLCEREPQHESN